VFRVGTFSIGGYETVSDGACRNNAVGERFYGISRSSGR
jgi:hypothetical protein